MKNIWQLQEAKVKFSKVISEAGEHGPQYITKHGKESAVVISIGDFKELTKKKNTLSAFFQDSPLYGLEIERAKRYGQGDRAMKYLLDTCVISELVKKRQDRNVVSWIDAQDELDLFLSAITLGEIQKGISRLDDATREQKIQLWLEDLKERFQGRILDLDLDTLLIWGKNSGELSKEGKKVPSIDALLAATAKQHKLCLVTRNIDDFRYCEVEVVNPWEEINA